MKTINLLVAMKRLKNEDEEEIHNRCVKKIPIET